MHSKILPVKKGYRRFTAPCSYTVTKRKTMKAFFIILSLLLSFSCRNSEKPQRRHPRMLTDALQRRVTLPDTINRVICIRSSAIRLVTYAGGAARICGIEEQEARPNEFTHLFAYPELTRKPIIGPGMGGDSELIMAARPDVIFMSSTTTGDADALQQQTGIPVITIDYGDIGRNRNKFYRSLRLIGQVLHTGDRVDSLIRYTDQQISELKKRCQPDSSPQKVYVGGISYKGQKGITSTDPYYAAFEFTGADNVAGTIDSAYISTITGTYIDWEQLMDWNPDVIFIDTGGRELVEEDFRNRQSLNRLLSAYNNRQIYTLWPYNNHHSNFEVMLINAWYVAKVLYPDRLTDIDISAKADEILTRFVGRPVGRQLEKCWGKYGNMFEAKGYKRKVESEK